MQITDWISDQEVPKWFAISDIIVLNHTRAYACASGSAHRALAANKPIVKTDDPSLEDIPGYQVPRQSQTELYESILTVLEDHDLQNKLIADSDDVCKKTSWDIVANQHVELYNELILKGKI